MTEAKAYHVQESYEAQCCIVFATSSAAARRLGAGELDTDWEGIEFCRRAQWADQYAGRRGGVPMKDLIDQGWSVTCGATGALIDNDKICDPEDDCAPVYVGEWVYYNVDEHDASVARDKRLKEIEQAVADEARAKFPGIEVTYIFHGRGTDNIPGVDMRVPGLEGQVSWQRGQSTVYVQKRDLEAWEAYVESIKGVAA